MQLRYGAFDGQITHAYELHVQPIARIDDLCRDFEVGTRGIDVGPPGADPDRGCRARRRTAGQRMRDSARAEGAALARPQRAIDRAGSLPPDELDVDVAALSRSRIGNTNQRRAATSGGPRGLRFVVGNHERRLPLPRAHLALDERGSYGLLRRQSDLRCPQASRQRYNSHRGRGGSLQSLVLDRAHRRSTGTGSAPSSSE